MAASITLSTTFSLDDIGRYVCNTLDEASASQDSATHPDARPFDFIVIGGGACGACCAKAKAVRAKHTTAASPTERTLECVINIVLSDFNRLYAAIPH